MQRVLTRMLAVAAVGTLLQTPVFAQGSDKYGTENWCKDATTLCWADDEKQAKAFSGLRFVFEPQLGVLVQVGDNKFEDTNSRRHIAAGFRERGRPAARFARLR